MKFITYFGLVFIGLPQVFGVCHPNTVCLEARDTIIQLDSSVLPEEREENRRRAWYIVPDDEDATFNTILAFKNFSSISELESVMVMTYKSSTEKEVQEYFGNLGNFELVIQDAIVVIIYVPIHDATKTPDFVLNYYTGCQVLTAAQDQISFPQSTYIRKTNQTACWFVRPSASEERRRVYFSIRDVSLNEGQQLAIWDMHTSQVVETAMDGEEFQLFAYETDGHSSILIDLVCPQEFCPRDFNSFFITYYAVTQDDVSCIQMLEACADKDYNPSEGCSITCPALQNILMEEYSNQLYTPMVRSGTFEGDTTSKRSGPSNLTTTATSITVRRRRQRCPLPSIPLRFCSCPRNFNKLAFCSAKVKCLTLGRCTFACIFHKVTTCLRIRFSTSLKLL